MSAASPQTIALSAAYFALYQSGQARGRSEALFDVAANLNRAATQCAENFAAGVDVIALLRSLAQQTEHAAIACRRDADQQLGQAVAGLSAHALAPQAKPSWWRSFLRGLVVKR